MTREELSEARMVLDYDNFSILEDDKGRYWAVRYDEPDEEPAEVELIARLDFPAGILTAQMKENPGKDGFEHKLLQLYNADFTGEASDDSCAYLWFCYKSESERQILPEMEDSLEEK